MPSDPVTLVQEFFAVGHCGSGKCPRNRAAAFVAADLLAARLEA